jgi:hypothetical protein
MSKEEGLKRIEQDFADKQLVFCDISYGVFDMGGFFKQFHDFVGYFQIEQSIEQSLNNSFRLWFWTDKVKVEEGKSRQVVIECKNNKEGLIYFTIEKI